MRLVMLGTGPFAVPTLRVLGASGHEVLALVTRPDRPQGNRPAPLNPMRAEAQRQNLPVFAPESINSDEARQLFQSLRPDLLVVCDYGQILKADVLALAAQGGINLHASLLPKYRGAAPIQWAIFEGEAETGASVIRMTAGLDAGPIVGQFRTPIGADETGGELEARLAELGAELVLHVVDQIAAGATTPLAQDRSQATKAPRIDKSQGQVDWSRTAQQIKNQVRAFDPWPCTFTTWHAAAREPLRLILHRVQVADAASTSAPGTIVATAPQLLVATGGGTLAIETVQPAGKRPLSAAEFLRGYPLQVGDTLGDLESVG